MIRRGAPWGLVLAGLVLIRIGLGGEPAASHALPSGPLAETAWSPDRPWRPPKPLPVQRPHPPVLLRLPSPGVQARVVPVDVTPLGALSVPDDPAVVGCWRAGASPGSARGSVVLDGHVDTHENGPGALFRLADLRPRDAAVLDSAGGEHEYVVEDVGSYPKEQLPAGLFDRSGGPRLVLITCGGPFDLERRSYPENVVAFAVPSPPMLPAEHVAGGQGLVEPR